MAGMTAKSRFPQPVGFSVEYFDPVADSLRTFVLTVFPDQKVQMVSACVCRGQGWYLVSSLHLSTHLPYSLDLQQQLELQAVSSK